MTNFIMMNVGVQGHNNTKSSINRLFKTLSIRLTQTLKSQQQPQGPQWIVDSWVGWFKTVHVDLETSQLLHWKFNTSVTLRNTNKKLNDSDLIYSESWWKLTTKIVPRTVIGNNDQRLTWVLTGLGLRETDCGGVSWLVNHADVHLVLVGVQSSQKTQDTDSLWETHS